MLSKKHSDPVCWKNKLEGMDCLPGEPAMQKNALWEKLDSRLQKKQADNKTRWYWIAAGLLPLIIIIVTGVPSTNDIAKQAVQKKENINTTVSVLPPASKEPAVVIQSLPVKQKQHVAVVDNAKKEIFQHTINMNESITAAVIPNGPEIKSVTDNSLKTDTSNAVAIVPAIKIKLPVVHINELETLKFAAPANYAQVLSGKPKKNKANNQNVATQESRIGFNIKLSSKN